MNELSQVLEESALADRIVISAAQMRQFDAYQALLLARNRQMNLTAITDPREVAVKHFLDSLTVELAWAPQAGERVIDIGAGAGFPGLPLAIRHPQVLMTLNDSARKKVDFLREVIEALQLPRVDAVWGRAEALGRAPVMRGQFDVVLARAVAHLGVLIEYALPLLKFGGQLIAMKGPGGEAEAAACAPVLDAIGGRLHAVQRLRLPDAGERQLVVVRKIRPTPDGFPRDAGMARKKPLYLDSARRTA